jgi:acyl-ACP thioesterase
LVLAQDQPVFRATSLWLCMDPHTRRLASLPDELAAQYAPRQETVTREDLSAWKPSCPENDPLSWTASIRLSDMDGNGHLNNAVYLDLAEDALYRAENSESKIDSCRILFGREVPAGTGTLDLEVWSDANHALVRLGGTDQNALVEIRHQ